MNQYSVKLNTNTRDNLGDIRSDFIEQAFLRFLYLKDELHGKQFSSQTRLLILKEIFSIFDEIQAINYIRRNFADPVSLNGIFELVVFLRSVLLHFPIFSTWDQINISPEIASEMMPKRRGGQIFKYLTENLGKNDIPFEVHYSGGMRNSSINLSAIKANPKKTYIKEIITEDAVITLMVDIVQYIYSVKTRIVTNSN